MIQYPAIFISFDDIYFTAWEKLLPLLHRYNAKITLFPTNVGMYSGETWGTLRKFMMAGHAIGNHTFNHVRASVKIEEMGVDAFLEKEIFSVQKAFYSNGIPNPVCFCYPWGNRNDKSDFHLSRIFKQIRIGGTRLYRPGELIGQQFIQSADFGKEPKLPISPHAKSIKSVYMAHAAQFFHFHNPDPARLKALLHEGNELGIKFQSFEELP